MTARRDIRVFIVDDHDVVRAGLKALLEREADIKVVGEARSAEEALGVLADIDPEVVILDYRLPGMDGDAFCREVAERRLRAAVVLLSAYLDEEPVQASFLAGARAYVVKDVEAAELKRAVRAVAGGGTYVDPKVAGRLMGWAARLDPRGTDSLRPTEIKILGHVAAGRTNAEIARLLSLSRHTVGSYLASVFRKLGVQQRAEAVAVAIRRGLIPAGGSRSSPPAAPARSAPQAAGPDGSSPSSE